MLSFLLTGLLVDPLKCTHRHRLETHRCETDEGSIEAERERGREEGKHFPRLLTAAMALIEWVDTERVTMERVQHTVLNTQQL